MSEIEVGEYVRTKNNGIKRIDMIFENKTVNKYGYERGSDWDGKWYSYIKTTDIVKHSKNIIDLLEVGDYVNGERIKCFRNDDCDYDIGTEYNDDYGIYFGFDKNNIETIVTKEQFTQAEYRIKEL